VPPQAPSGASDKLLDRSPSLQSPISQMRRPRVSGLVRASAEAIGSAVVSLTAASSAAAAEVVKQQIGPSDRPSGRVQSTDARGIACSHTTGPSSPRTSAYACASGSSAVEAMVIRTPAIQSRHPSGAMTPRLVSTASRPLSVGSPSYAGPLSAASSRRREHCSPFCLPRHISADFQFTADLRAGRSPVVSPSRENAGLRSPSPALFQSPPRPVMPKPKLRSKPTTSGGSFNVPVCGALAMPSLR